ncbi:MAG: 3-phosphoglycerate dehydrogenase [Gammaproteobacteria bacterium]|nr:MAG: 3-phosphoglycerate dehydrogenase [Gammaproteobacteria bacterium]RLA22910.1 MAG: 3-phosphoglycerate dehydrogenase [Gammaproteobacteria bacterium]
MHKILTFNNIAVSGLERFPRDAYEVASEIGHPEAIMLRSHKLSENEISETVLAVGRAGAGVNNIPVDYCSDQGIPVFNSPGANANAVKELVLAGMLLACRNICQAWNYTQNLDGDDSVLSKQVEAGKKTYVGFELPGKTLGIIGLGAIGVQVANAAQALGMNVIGYDPLMTVERAWQLSASVEQASSIDDLLTKSDFVTIHVPLTDQTRNTISADRIKLMKDNAVVLNFSREGIVETEAVCEALDNGKLHAYVCDFPNNYLKNRDKVIALPHLGASTVEAEENCAIMVANQLRDFIENGNIHNSVNFPGVVMPRVGGSRISITNRNVPNMVGQISNFLAEAKLNIIDLLNRSKGELAYTLIDIDSEVSEETLAKIGEIDGVLRVRSV